MSIIKNSWLNYRVLVLPANAPAIQVIECRRAFYAGAASLFGSVMNSLSPGDGVEDSDMRVMEDLDKEIKDFGKELDEYMLGPSGKPS